MLRAERRTAHADQYIGIDLHKAFFQACAVIPTGDSAVGRPVPPDAGGPRGADGAVHAARRVAVEASTPTWHFADGVVRAVGELRIVDPLKTKLKAGYAAKTDRLDARRLADALRRESVVGIYYPPLAIRELRELCRARHALVQVRTALINRLRAVLCGRGSPMRGGWRRPPMMRGSRRWRCRHAPRRVSRRCAPCCDVRARSGARRREVRPGRAPIRSRSALQQIRGIGPVLALTIRAEIGEIRRFPTPRHLASYAGLVPRVERVPGHYRHGRITRRGSPWLRWALIEAAIHGTEADRSRRPMGPPPGLRKGALKARVALARVLCDGDPSSLVGIE